MSEAWAAAKKNAVTLFYLSILGFIERVWTVATYFIIPAIIIAAVMMQIFLINYVM